MTNPIHRSHAILLMGLLLLVSLPHLPRFSPVTMVAVMGLLAWNIHSLWRKGHLPQPSMLVRVILVVVAVAILPLSSYKMVNREAGVALLMTMLFLKMLEMRTLRDFYFLLLWLFFLAISHVLFSQSMPMALYVLVCMLALVTFVIYLARPHATLGDWRPSLRLTVTLTLQALPVMILLFLFFPRLPGPLLGIPREMAPSSARSGLSDSMEPGSISSLILADQLAFRVDFTGPPPTAGQLYWRGPVLWNFWGRSWHTASLHDEEAPQSTSASAIHYWVTLEPHGREWLFALDYPLPPPAPFHQVADGQWHNDKPVYQRLRYQASSSLNQAVQINLSHQQRRLGLQLPKHGNEQSRTLARQWRDAHPDDPAAVVKAALHHFNQNPFYYTLNPPLLGKEAVDEFMFQSQRGFCEHYAGAFTFLMRAAGIPARVVTGYLGGKIHPLDGHLTVRQADAHAWSEVWLPQSGWQRVDPTSAIDPQRVDPSPSPASQVLHLSPVPPSTWPWFLDFQQVWDAVDNRWNLWILGYGREQQLALFSKLGGSGSWQDLTLTMTTTVTLALAGVALLMVVQFRPWRWRRQPVLRHYETFCHHMATLGTPRLPHEGPLDYAHRLEAIHPDLKAWIWQVTQLYIALRYDQQETNEGLEYFRRLVHRTKIG
ncbi:MAG: DUF3488 domain-containing transglutaminase family protein [Magnetococcales bacterium]|nr:DUF3488 domain-containing transglutaminase family protein [Magnetococcales bacterium]NGZ27307.1 DUF3488 domain-containing transglutaminase family protein [Magnetococcales bacterium]